MSELWDEDQAGERMHICVHLDLSWVPIDWHCEPCEAGGEALNLNQIDMAYKSFANSHAAD